jgi:hypothetical protein
MRQTREATVFVFEFDTQTHLRTIRASERGFISPRRSGGIGCKSVSTLAKVTFLRTFAGVSCKGVSPTSAAIARMRFAFERATQIMANYRLCWQHLADEYRAIGKVAEANRAAASVR